MQANRAHSQTGHTGRRGTQVDRAQGMQSKHAGGAHRQAGHKGRQDTQAGRAYKQIGHTGSNKAHGQAGQTGSQGKQASRAYRRQETQSARIQAGSTQAYTTYKQTGQSDM